MNAMPTLYALGTCVLATMAAAKVSPSWFEARTTGAAALTLRGSAEFGSVRQRGESGAFVLTLGAQSPTGAVLFTSRAGQRPGPGVYRLAPDSSAVQALVVTGSPTRPTGAYRAQGGTLTITRSRGDFMAGHFELDAVGYAAADPSDENRPLRVRGTFTATPGQ